MTDKTPQEVLREAAEYISEHGWAQGVYQDDKGRVCALGAIGIIATGCIVMNGIVLDANEVVERATYLLSAQLPNANDPDRIRWRGGVPDWNDDPNTTAEDVILAMKRAAEDA